MPNGEPEIDGTADRARESNFSAALSGRGDGEHDRDHGEEKGGPFLHGVLSRSDPFSRFYLVADGSHASCPAFEKAGLYRDPACCDPCGKVSPAGCRSARSPRRCTAKIRRTRRSASRSARITGRGETSLGQRAEAASGQIIAAGERGGYYHEERGEFRAPHPRAHRSVAARGQEGPADEAVRRPGKPGAGQKGSEGIVTDAANPGHLFRRRRWRRS